MPPSPACPTLPGPGSSGGTQDPHGPDPQHHLHHHHHLHSHHLHATGTVLPSGTRVETSSLAWVREQRSRARLMLILGVAQMVLGALIVTVSFAALALTSSARIRHSCPFWAGFSVLLSGLIGVISWKRPISLVVTFFTLLSGVCVMLNLAGSILSCQNAQLVNSLTHCQLVKPGDDGVCVCCERQQTGGCTNLGETVRLNPLQDCSTIRLALKDLLFSVCALTILATIVCALATAMRCVQIITADVIHMFVPQRSSHVQHDCLNTHNSLVHQTVDFEEFVPPIPPPPYYPPEYTYTPVMDANRTSRLHLIHCPYDICVPRVGCEAVYPGELPPPYEAVVAQTRTTQALAVDTGVAERAARVEGGGSPCRDASVSVEVHARGRHGGGGGCAVAAGVPPSLPTVPRPSSPDSSPPSGKRSRRPGTPSPSPTPVRDSFSCASVQGGQLSSDSLSPNVDGEERLCCDALDDIRPSEPGVRNAGTGSAQSSRTSPTLEAPRERPRSLVDLKTYQDTKILVSRFLESSSGDLPPDVRHVVNDIKSVIASDERHMEEAILSASVLDQVGTSETTWYETQSVRTSPLSPRRDGRAGATSPRSCGDLSEPGLEGRRQRSDEQSRPHSHVGVLRETVL
ncbi:unnamed protein product [Lampetra fluviatilis]